MDDTSLSGYTSLPLLAKQLRISHEKLIATIHEHQIPVCTKLPTHIAKRLSGIAHHQNSTQIRRLYENEPHLFPDPISFPKTLPDLVYIPLLTNELEQLHTDPYMVLDIQYLCSVTEGRLVPYDTDYLSVNLTISNLVVLNGHVNKLMKVCKRRSEIDESPLSKRERGSLLRTVGAMMDILLQTHHGGGTEDAVINDILSTYHDLPGLSRSNLQKIFAESKIALSLKEIKALELP